MRPQPWTYPEFWSATREDYIELNRASIRIKLRINREECDSKLILQPMGEMETLFRCLTTDSPKTSIDKINRIVDALERDAPPLLKKEWQRVKTGEPIYRKAKLLTQIIFAATGFLAAWLFWRMLR